MLLLKLLYNICRVPLFDPKCCDRRQVTSSAFFSPLIRLAPSETNVAHPMADLLAAYTLTDAFPFFHPNVQPFTFFCRNTPGSLLDRAYVPPPPTSPTPASRPPCLTTCPSMSGWPASCNQPGHQLSPPLTVSSILLWLWRMTSCPSSQQCRPPWWPPGTRGTCPAAWWKDTAKPACRSFCMIFSKLVAHPRRELASLLLAGLQVALLANVWPGVTALMSHLKELAPTTWLARQ